jgi:hypothetical protein
VRKKRIFHLFGGLDDAAAGDGFAVIENGRLEAPLIQGSSDIFMGRRIKI